MQFKQLLQDGNFINERTIGHDENAMEHKTWRDRSY